MAPRETTGPFLLHGCEVVLPDRLIPEGAVLVEDGRIVFSGRCTDAPALPRGCREIDGRGMRATPALWETHIHGCGGISTEDMTAESLAAMAAFLAARGVGAFLPTLVPDERAMSALAASLDAAPSLPGVGGRALGMYVEGPFVSHARRGAIPESLLRPPSVEYLRRMQELSRRHLRALTVAPELQGAADVIARLPGLGILPMIGHSDAGIDSLRGVECIQPLGVTHLFNGMSGVSHKSPGLALWALLNQEAYTELNCDGTHVHDAAVKLALRSRPGERMIAISDAVAPAGLPLTDPPGRLYGRTLVAKGSGLFYADTDVLVGSRSLIPDQVARLVSDFQLPVPAAVAMATANPARLFGFPRKGALLEGFDADVALLSPDFSSCRFLSWEGLILVDALASTAQAR